MLQPKPNLSAKGWQVVVTDYSDEPDLVFNLAGVNVVISTISGASQLSLIDAAFKVGVTRFAPAEFEGLPSLRPVPDALDRGRSLALERLRQYQPRGMQYCVFVCGIFYERFAPGGMIASNIGRGSGISGEGDYIMNTRQMRARVPYEANGQPATICATSVQDVGRFVAAAIGMLQWPVELRMCGERMNVSDLVRVAEIFRGRPFTRVEHSFETLESSLRSVQQSQDMQGQLRIISLIATTEGRYDFTAPDLNSLVPFTPTPFQLWLRLAWAGQFTPS
ncbi:hypothetical protein MMC31_001685 [Peltigera leucophlebia]|nr:hypothetical protein [Peltigera leucophlebia]